MADPQNPPAGVLLGYARVSTPSQATSLEDQHARLTAHGCTRIYEDTASGARASRPGLDALRAYARPGDTITVTRLDRLGRSTLDTLHTLTELDADGVHVQALDVDLDTSTPSGRLVIRVMLSLAEWERDMLRERTREGLAHARAQGRVGGRRRSLTPQQVTAIEATLATGALTLQEVAQLHGVSARTISRVKAGTYTQPRRP